MIVSIGVDILHEVYNAASERVKTISYSCARDIVFMCQGYRIHVPMKPYWCFASH